MYYSGTGAKTDYPWKVSTCQDVAEHSAYDVFKPTGLNYCPVQRNGIYGPPRSSDCVMPMSTDKTANKRKAGMRFRAKKV